MSLYLRNVVIVGAGGSIGKPIVEKLAAEGKHTVTALTRSGSSSVMPDGLLHNVVKADYENPEELVAALKGQDVLIITMGATAPPETSIKLIDAAASAGIKYIVPNEWSSDREQLSLANDTLLAAGQHKIRDYIVSKGVKWFSIGCAFWYEFSLGGGEVRYGFDFHKKTLTLYGDGTTKISTSTWPQTALALARVLALPLTATSTSGPSIARFESKQVLVSSFNVSQRDMFHSVLRVTGDNETDWTITHEDAKDRYNRGMDMFRKGSFVGFGIFLYARAFYPEDPMNHEAKKVNDLLGLPRADLDAATKEGIRMALAGEVQY